MEHNHQLPRTTHTVEMDQIAELNDRLGEGEPSPAIRASMLGLQGAELSAGSDDSQHTLPGDALLARLSSDGPPEYPYVHAHFRTSASASDQGSLKVELHTDALRKLSHLLHLQHVWGV